MADIKKISQLYDLIINYDNDSIIPFLNDKWQGKEKQESLFRLFAYLNVIKEFNNYTVCDGNFNEGTISKNTDKSILFNKSLKDKGDKSDLSLISNDCKTLIATTSKSLDNYCIGNLETDSIKLIYHDKYVKTYSLRICIVIRDKKELYELAKKSEKTSKRIKDIITDPSTIIFDWTDINIWYNIAKSVYKNKSIKEICNFVKVPLINKFHQEFAIMNTIDISQYYKNILWGHIPRSGKSYIIAGTIYKISINSDEFNVLIITTAPNETKEQYLTIFNSYCQFEDFTVHYIEKENSIKKPKLTKKNIIICSKQFLQTKGVKEDKVKSIKWLKELKFSWRFIDESHNGGTTDLSKKVLEAYGNTEGVISVYITATYMKPLQTFNIPIEATVLWDLEDVKLCQAIDKEESVDKLVAKYGNNVLKVLAKSNKDYIKEDYSLYPTIEFMKFDFKNNVKNAIIENYKDTNTGFSTDSIFLLKYKELKTNKKDIETINEFQDEEGVIKLMHAIFGKTEKNELFTTNDTTSVFSEINKICKNGNINSRTFSNEDPLIVLAFLPCKLHNTPLNRLQETLSNLIIKHNILPDYDVIYLNYKENSNKTSKEIINDALKNVKLANKKGLLVLSGLMCSLAVSLPKCDIVLMLNNTESYETYYQMIFRCMTEDTNKKIGFVVDMNLQRVCCVITEYASKIYKNNSTKEAIKYVLEQNIIRFNSSEWMNNYFGLTNVNIDNVVNEIYNKYTANPSNAIDSILKSLELKVKVLTKDQELFNKIFTTNTSSKNIKNVIDELTNSIEIKKGIDNVIFDDNSSVVSDETDGSSGNSSSSSTSKTKIVKNVNFITDIMKPLMSLLCLLTINADNSSTTFKDLCIWIKNSKVEKAIIINQLAIWWNKTISISTDVIDMFITLYDTYLYNNDVFNSAFMRLKEMFSIARNNKDELSKIIDKYLIPQDIEKKQNAEVSTPYILRIEMINKIPNEFWKSVRRVLEPCAGKGGFLLDIINKFMEGLKDLYEDEEERYRVIVEECLYWSEFNPTNVYICKLLLDPFGKYKLNYNEGDTLILDIKEKWNIEGFDAIIGNPPYNSSGSTGTGNTIWQDFTKISLDKFLKKDGYLLFVHPPGWRKPNTEKGKFYGLYKIMTKNNQMVYLSIHGIKDGQQTFNCGTRYDWYLIKKKEKYTTTIVNDEKGNDNIIDMNDFNWLPNYNIETIKKILAVENEEKCEIIQSMSAYEPRKKWMSSIKTEEFKYSCIHSTTKKGAIYKFSKINDKGHFGISKVIFGDSGINEPIIDINGIYGMTQHAMAIKVENIHDANKLYQSLKSDKMTILIDSCLYSSYAIDWNIFKEFKKDFWKEFI